MKSNYEVLGKYIRPIDVRNRDLVVDYLLGLSITKRFIPSIANTVGTEFNSYKIVRTGQFAYGPVTSRNGDKITIALLDDKDCIISSSYSVFEVIDANELLPEYLMMWFKRPEFDRYARFKSHGSVREIFDWDELCKVELPIPDIGVQRSIVRAYNTIEGRIRHLRQLNDNLEATAFTLYSDLIADLDKNAILSDVADIVMGSSPEGESYNENGNGTVFYQGRSDFGFRFPTRRLFTTSAIRMAKAGDVLVSVRAPVGDINIATEPCCIGRGLAAIRSKTSFQSFIYYTMLKLKFELSKFNDEGTVFGAINKDDLRSLAIACPSNPAVADFDRKSLAIDVKIATNEHEITKLQYLQSLLLSRLVD